tara:strand:+ start:2474 stop:4873 length:2400 start_codon:yes stop_codon:yes gene_type:complete
MIEDKRDEFIAELRQRLQQGDTAKDWRRNFRREYKSQIEEEGLDFTTFVREIISAASERGGEDDNTDIINNMNGLLRFVLDDNENELSYEKLRTIEVNDTIPNRTLLEESGLTIAAIESQLDNLLKRGKEANLPNVDMVEEIFERMSRLLAGSDTSDEEEQVTMQLEDFFEDLSEINIKLAKDRAKMYRFWKRVNKEYSKFIEAIDDFIEACQGTPLEEGAAKLAAHKPDNYIIKVKPQSITLDKKEIRLFEVLEQLGGQIDPKARKEWMLRRKITEDKARGDKDYDWQTGEAKYNLELLGDEAIEHVRAISNKSYDMDPIMAYIWKEFDTPIAMGELGFFTRRLSWLQKKTSPASAKKLEDKILQLKAEASTWDEDAYLPMGDWLAKFFKHVYGRGLEGKMQQFDKLAKGTEKWFEDLQELLFEKQTDSYAEYPVQQPQDAGTTSPMSMYGKPAVMDPERSQGLLEPKMKEVPKEIETALSQLKKMLNRYYFEPLDSGYFLKETVSSYQVVESGKVLPSIERLVKPILSSGGSPGQAYKMLRYEFGDSNAISAEKDLMRGAVDNLNTLNLKKLTMFFKDANQGKKHENWAEYIDSIEDAVEILDDIFQDDEKSNRIWAARSIARTLERRTEPDEEGHKWVMKDAKLFGKDIIDIMNLELHQDPISNLTTLLQSDAIGPYIVEKQNYAPKESKKLEETIDKLLEVLLTFTKAMDINHAILNVHDVIRKMQNKSIEYGFLQTNDIEDMDYLINKMYKDYTLEINAMEINSIVKSSTSFENISRNYGLSEEVVYVIKGLCR